MQTDLLDLYRRGSAWCGEKVAGATALDVPTSCDGWTVRDLLNHILETQHYFAGSARGEDVSPPGPNPPKRLTEDPVGDFASARADVLQAFGQEGALEKTGPALGIAFSDQLLHGWDLAQSTGQDTTMPDGLPESAYRLSTACSLKSSGTGYSSRNCRCGTTRQHRSASLRTPGAHRPEGGLSQAPSTGCSGV